MYNPENEKPFGCAICKSSFPNIDGLTTHLTFTHSKEYFYWCGNCAQAFNCITALTDHLTSKKCKNKNPYKFKCSVEDCTFEIEDPSKYCYHFKITHKGKNILNCLYCDKIFSIPHFLVMHMQRECTNRPTAWPAAVPFKTLKNNNPISPYQRSPATNTNSGAKNKTAAAASATKADPDDPDDPDAVNNGASTSNGASANSTTRNSQTARPNSRKVGYLPPETKNGAIAPTPDPTSTNKRTLMNTSKRLKIKMSAAAASNDMDDSDDDSASSSDSGWQRRSARKVVSSDRVLRRGTRSSTKADAQAAIAAVEAEKVKETTSKKKPVAVKLEASPERVSARLKKNYVSPVDYDDSDEDIDDISLDAVIPSDLKVHPIVISPKVCQKEAKIILTRSDAVVKIESPIKIARTSSQWLKSWEEWNAKFLVHKSTQSMTFLSSSAKLSHFFKCMNKSCIFSTNEESLFKKHCETSHKNGEFMCLYCLESFKVSQHLISHMIELHGNRNYQCSKCLYRAVSGDHLTPHIEKCHKTDDAPILFMKFESKGGQKCVENVTPDNLLRFMCELEYCSFSTLNLKEFQKHNEENHPSAVRYPCCFCEDNFKSFDLLIMHLRVHNLHNFQCYFCMFGAESSDILIQHICLNHEDMTVKYFNRTQ